MNLCYPVSLLKYIVPYTCS